MVKNIKIKQIHTNSLSCEPLIERAANGDLICLCQCDGPCEPAPENRVYAFRSSNEGESWSKKQLVYPENGHAVYCTELCVENDALLAYLTIHTGKFHNWSCTVVKSTDNGQTWEDLGAPPFFSTFTFLRKRIVTRDGRILIPYQHYPVDPEKQKEAFERYPNLHIAGGMKNKLGYEVPYYESGVLESKDGGKTYERHVAVQWLREEVFWPWLEPTIAELSDGTIVMLLRRDGSGALYRCDSTDGGKTWGKCFRTDIPNPGNKPCLIALDKGRIALLHTPNTAKRYPFQLWISDDDMKTWKSKTTLTDFPGSYSYSDGFYEDGHIKFVIEHNRHTILYFDVTLEK